MCISNSINVNDLPLSPRATVVHLPSPKKIVRSQECSTALDLTLMQVTVTSLEKQPLRNVTDITYLLRFIRERLGNSDEMPLGDPKSTLIEGDLRTDSYSSDKVQPLIDFACDQGQCSEESLRTQLKDYLRELFLQTEEALEQIAQKVENCRGRASLPDDMELNRILKYDTRISNRIHKSLHELQRLQAYRLAGQPVATAAVDVTLTVDSPMIDDSCPDLDRSQQPSAMSKCAQPAEAETTNELSLACESIIIPSEQLDSGEPVPVAPEPVRPKLVQIPKKGLKLKDYLGQGETAQLPDQLDAELMGSKDSDALPNGAANE